MMTEDIDITWKLQRAGWDVRFEPNALVWILMPETLAGLWKQRLRWACGGAQVLLKNLDVLARPWPVEPRPCDPPLSAIVSVSFALAQKIWLCSASSTVSSWLAFLYGAPSSRRLNS